MCYPVTLLSHFAWFNLNGKKNVYKYSFLLTEANAKSRVSHLSIFTVAALQLSRSWNLLEMLGDYLVCDTITCLEKFGKCGVPKNGGILDVLPCHTSVTLCIIQSKWSKKCEDSTFLGLKSFFYNPLKSSLKIKMIVDHLDWEI